MKKVEGTKIQSKIVLCEKNITNIWSHIPPKPGDCLHSVLVIFSTSYRSYRILLKRIARATGAPNTLSNKSK